MTDTLVARRLYAEFPTRTRTDVRTAVHEAGHAVVGVAVRCPVRRATIVPDPAGSFAGCVFTRTRWVIMDWSDAAPSAIRRRVLTTLAGRQAIRMILGKRDDPGSRDDIAGAVNFVADLLQAPGLWDVSDGSIRLTREGQRAFRTEWDETIARVNTLLLERSEQVVTVARALLANGRVAERRLRDLARDGTPNPSQPPKAAHGPSLTR